MPSNNHLTLAVAGSRKTQGIVDACAEANVDERILIVTYTNANQSELRERLATHAGDHLAVEVSGWFSFLLAHFVRPFLPYCHPGTRLLGFDNTSNPPPFTRSEAWERYFTPDGDVRKVHLPQLAHRIEGASAGAGIRRLEKIYDRIFIDEVQDLCGYDLEILKLLMSSALPIEMVGDVRQAILATNPQEQKNGKYRYLGIWEWFREEEQRGRLTITQRAETWRCHPAIAAFADTIFDPSWGFDPTTSHNQTITDHDGVHQVQPTHVRAYVDRYTPLVLRHSVGSAKEYAELDPMNFGVSKGMTRDRVLILPTAKITKFLKTGAHMEDRTAASFYVAVTRAQQSVTIVLDPGTCSTLPTWTPPAPHPQS